MGSQLLGDCVKLGARGGVLRESEEHRRPLALDNGLPALQRNQVNMHTARP